MMWTRDGLTEDGFEGFVPFRDLGGANVPQAAGVYVVMRANREPPRFLDRSVSGWFKDRDPSATPEQLSAAWLEDAEVLYIGKASTGKSGRRGLRRRLTEYQRHGAGEKIGHWGGRYIWQLEDSSLLLVAWKEIPDEDPDSVESRMLDDFVRQYGARPFANRKIGRASLPATR